MHDNGLNWERLLAYCRQFDEISELKMCTNQGVINVKLPNLYACKEQSE